MTDKTGGPAFPNNGDNTPRYPIFDGMSLRDYFAAKALQGMLASDPVVDRTTVDKAAWARVAYNFADAMLKERDR